MSVLVLFVSLKPADYGNFIRSAVIPPEGQTGEFLRLCDVLNGKMPGEDGETRAEIRELAAAGNALEALCDAYGGTWSENDGCTVVVPTGMAVTRVVTVSYMF